MDKTSRRNASSATAVATRYRVATMDCSAEESEIRRALDLVEGITSLRFDLSQRALTVVAEPEALRAATEAMRRVGFDPQPLKPPQPQSQPQPQPEPQPQPAPPPVTNGFTPTALAERLRKMLRFGNP